MRLQELFVTLLATSSAIGALRLGPRIGLAKPFQRLGDARSAAVPKLRGREARTSQLEAVGAGDAGSTSRVEDPLSNARYLLWGNRAKAKSASPRPDVLKNVLAGITVALAMVPEAIAFAFVAGVSPLTGLWTTAILGFFAAAFGGRPGIMSSASGACSVVMASLVAAHGPVYLTAAVLLAGALQLGAGGAKLGKFIRLVPHPVMLGFVNGLAVVMSLAQLRQFQTAAGVWMTGGPLIWMTSLVGLTAWLVQAVPKVTTKVPSSLVAVVVTTLIANVFKLPVPNLGDLAGAETFRGGLEVLPKIAVPAVPWMSPDLWMTILPYAVTMASVGLIESLLTLNVVDGMVDDGTRGSTRKECYGQGLGNVASGLTGGMGGCALIGQSIINVASGGGSSRISGISMALFLSLGIVVGAPLLAKVPAAALVGVMAVVCYKTFAWSSLRLWKRIPKIDTAVIALVSVTTVVKNLAVAVGAGTALSAVAFAYKTARRMGCRVETLENGYKAYKLQGPLFFGSTRAFADLFDVKKDPNDVVIDFLDSRVTDHSALEALDVVCQKYAAEGKRVHLRHISGDCFSLIARKWGQGRSPYLILEPDPNTDPSYGVFEDYDAQRFGLYSMPISTPGGDYLNALEQQRATV